MQLFRLQHWIFSLPKSQSLVATTLCLDVPMFIFISFFANLQKPVEMSIVIYSSEV